MLTIVVIGLPVLGGLSFYMMWYFLHTEKEVELRRSLARLARNPSSTKTGAEEEVAIRLFNSQQEMLREEFFRIASSLGKPRDLKWVRCHWTDDPICFATDLESGLFTAFVGTQIHFEAVEGGDMEEVEAVHDFREASAVFHYQSGRWGTGGRALLNMVPQEAVARLEGQFAAYDVAQRVSVSS